jgi:hypothetical protein
MRLVKALLAELKRQKFEITNAALEGYESPTDVEKQVPDIKACNRKKEYVIFGVAATCEELTDEATEVRLTLFSNRYMSSGKSKGEAAPLCVAISKGCEPLLEDLLKKLKLEQKKNIFLYAF